VIQRICSISDADVTTQKGERKMFRSIIILLGFAVIFLLGSLMASEMVHMSNTWITKVEREAMK
jgi:flagellar basal body-associated protein FliL